MTRRRHRLSLLGILFCLLGLSAAGCSSFTRFQSTPTDPLSAMIRLYEGPLNHMAALRGGECPMYPSCSAYAKAAVDKYGFFIGWMMASDRLLRCGRDEVRLGPKIFIHGRWKVYDPLENNTPWGPRQ